MSRFYGEVVGNRGPAARRGSHRSGLRLDGMTEEHGKVRVLLKASGDHDYVKIVTLPHRGRGRRKTLFEGRLGAAK